MHEQLEGPDPGDITDVSGHRTIDGALDALHAFYAEPHYHHLAVWDREAMAANLRDGKLAILSMRIGGSSQFDTGMIRPVQLQE